jgi:hypothetical protein
MCDPAWRDDMSRGLLIAWWSKIAHIGRFECALANSDWIDQVISSHIKSLGTHGYPIPLNGCEWLNSDHDQKKCSEGDGFNPTTFH